MILSLPFSQYQKVRTTLDVFCFWWVQRKLGLQSLSLRVRSTKFNQHFFLMYFWENLVLLLSKTENSSKPFFWETWALETCKCLWFLTYQFPKEKVSKVESVIKQPPLKVKNVCISLRKSDTKENVNIVRSSLAAAHHVRESSPNAEADPGDGFSFIQSCRYSEVWFPLRSLLSPHHLLDHKAG